jgi:N4-gp56 family major capsid protein
MPATVSYGSISQRTAAWAATEMLEHVMPIEVLARFADTKDIPKNTADNALFRRPIPFAPATAPLSEGVTPPGHAMQYENVPVQLQQYGDWVEITDKVQDMAEDPVLKDASQLSGEQAAETMEIILWGVLRAGTNVQFMNGTQRNQVNTALTGAAGKTMLANCVRFLKQQRAKFVTEMLDATVKIATVPVAAAFIAFGHTDLEPDLQNLPNYTSVENYGMATKALPYEVGKAGSIRFILSPLLSPFADAGGAKGAMKSTSGVSADVYPLVIVAKKSYANVGLRGARAITPMVLNPGVPRGGDPLGQRGSVAWKSYYAAMRLNEAWILRLEVAATA